MTSKRLAVLAAIKAAIEIALPQATVLGLDGHEAPPANVPPHGLVILRPGDPGQPVEITMSPLIYWWDHVIPLEVSAVRRSGSTSEQALDAMLLAIGNAIAADRTLGGLCEWLEPSSAATGDIYAEGGGLPPRGADITITASYSTPFPLA